MDKIKNVLIVGLGLIGGSLALGMKRNHPDLEIAGLNRRRETLEQGLALGVIDEAAADLQTAAEKADVIFFCTPVQTTERMFQEIVTFKLKPHVIITDAGSTKGDIVKKAAILKAHGLTFVGGHPMAGSHKSGVTAANVDLFESAYYLFTPTSPEESSVVEVLKELLAGTRAKFLITTPEEHDAMTGMVSHLPHIIASGLVNQMAEFTKEHPTGRLLAAGGFRDITRIASSDPVMWTDILISNRSTLLNQIQRWQQEMTTVAGWLETSDEAAIFEFFKSAKETRDDLPIHKGAIPAFYDLFVDIPDYPGMIAEITGILAQDEISLINVKILETREDVTGVMQLTFKTHEELQRGKACIENKTDYPCYEK